MRKIAASYLIWCSGFSLLRRKGMQTSAKRKVQKCKTKRKDKVQNILRFCDFFAPYEDECADMKAKHPDLNML